MKPRLSVIIPCYNQGRFLQGALESLKDSNSELIEIIIVNDGSTDSHTNMVCAELKKSGIHVIEQKNSGLSAARNTGINNASGEYILLLDADNKIRKEYIYKGIQILDMHPNTGVVYGDANYFGEKQGEWKQGAFNLQRLMIANFIDACAVVRKNVFDAVGLYDINMKWGWEDWEMWLRIAFAGYDFYYLNEIVFDYRVAKTSMSKTLYATYEIPNMIENYIHQKYPSKMGHEWVVEHYVKRFKKNPLLFTCKLFLKAFMPGYYQKLLIKNKIRKGL